MSKLGTFLLQMLAVAVVFGLGVVVWSVLCLGLIWLTGWGSPWSWIVIGLVVWVGITAKVFQ